MIVRTKDHATDIHELDLYVWDGVVRLGRLMEEYGIAGDIVITAGRDGAHKADSFHYKGRAVDIRCKMFAPPKVEVVTREFRKRHGRLYDLLWENAGTPNEHWHLEYDPKENT